MRDRRRGHANRPEENNPYRAYSAGASSRRMAVPGANGPRQSALFHGGNAGHLWRGEVFSILAEAILATGTIIWLADLTMSPGTIAAALMAYAAPWLIAGSLALPFQNSKDPGVPMRFMGIARAVLAAALIAMHFVTILPVLYALLFGISLLGRLRQGAREAAARLCLAPGESEAVANDLHVGGAIASVAGPLLATLLYVLTAERIWFVAGLAAILMGLASNSDGFLDPLPESRREFLLDSLDDAVPEPKQRAELLAAASLKHGVLRGVRVGPEDQESEEERAMPEWMQVIPRNPAQEMADVRMGIGLAGGRSWSRTALLILAILGLVSSGLGVIEVFFLIYWVQLPALFLGPMVAAEAAGMVVGAMLVTASGGWRSSTLMGLAFMAAGLIVMASLPLYPVVLGSCFALGMGNGLAVLGARRGARRGLAGPGQRAVTAAERFITGLTGVAGAGVFAYIYAGSAALPGPVGAIIGGGSGLGIGQVMLGLGISIAVVMVVALVQLFMAGSGDPTVRKPEARGRHHQGQGLQATGRVAAMSRALRPGGFIGDDDDYEDDYDDYDSREMDSRQLDSRQLDSRQFDSRYESRW